MGRTWRRLAIAGALAAALATAPPALADGTETLGPPGVTVATGTDAIVAGVGMHDFENTPNSFDVTVPAGATVKQVLAYWQGQYTSEFSDELPDNQITVNGHDITGTQIAYASNPYLGELFWTYRTDITSLGLVNAGTSTLTVSNMNFVSRYYEPTGNKGFGVVVIFDDGSSSTFTGLVDGQDYAYAGFDPPYDATVPQTLAFEPADTDRAASLALLVGEALDHDQTGTAGNVIAGVFDTGQTFSVVNRLQSHQGAEFDAENLPITIPAGASSVALELISEGGDFPSSLIWIAAGLTVDNAFPPEEPEPCKPHWGSKYKWLVWLKWWKKWLSHEYGDKHADRYASYWGGDDDDECKPDDDDCKDRKGGFFFGRHWGHCKPDHDWCKSKYAVWVKHKHCKPDHDDDCKAKDRGRSSNYWWHGGKDDDCDHRGRDHKGKHGNVLDWLRKYF